MCCVMSLRLPRTPQLQFLRLQLQTALPRYVLQGSGVGVWSCVSGCVSHAGFLSLSNRTCFPSKQVSAADSVRISELTSQLEARSRELTEANEK